MLTLERGTLIPALSNLKQMTELAPRISTASDSFSGLSDPDVNDGGGATSKHAERVQGSACRWGVTTVVPAEGVTQGPALEFPSLVMAAEAKVWVDLEEGRTALKRALMPRPSLLVFAPASSGEGRDVQGMYDFLGLPVSKGGCIWPPFNSGVPDLGPPEEGDDPIINASGVQAISPDPNRSIMPTNSTKRRSVISSNSKTLSRNGVLPFRPFAEIQVPPLGLGGHPPLLRSLNNLKFYDSTAFSGVQRPWDLQPTTIDHAPN
ncbi:hypothetical protein PCANC_12491 [Puccinia coronata f. sp. avenae]|uniref:Uncharacterized protein n=1 Tax=Puccinia coronata f. sp. avenae TaxID=200324 RepID=A0A2N5ULF7_9BASI|nr:hypothetical protein PCANC_12491 [Puccinia coronata f. sp. avenae]